MQRATYFDLVTLWRFAAPLADVWAILEKPDDWPSWWSSVVAVQMLQPGDAQGIGAVRRFTWRTALPYRLSFDMRVRRIDPMARIEGEAFGELEGEGVWTLNEGIAGTDVRYDWRVRVAKPWMIAISPLLRPVFAWNHGKVMEAGRRGLERRLGEAQSGSSRSASTM